MHVPGFTTPRKNGGSSEILRSETTFSDRRKPWFRRIVYFISLALVVCQYMYVVKKLLPCVHEGCPRRKEISVRIHHSEEEINRSKKEGNHSKVSSF